jgi:glycosyltransferase involved in cell wall biosynthesis
MARLLMLITSLAGGGAERVASELSLNLSPNIERKIVILTDQVTYPSKEPPLPIGIEFRKPLVLSFVYALLKGTFEYKKILKRYTPEHSLSFLTLDNFINILSNYGSKSTKTIISVHIALSMKFRNSLMDKVSKQIVKCLYNKADLVIAVSEGVGRELVTDFGIKPGKVKILYNPVDINKIRCLAGDPVDDEEWFNDNIPIVINVGRLVKQKGQWHLIRAFSKVREKVVCRLVIRGSGELKSYLQSLVDDLNLTNDVIFLDWKDNPYKYISKSTVFASSSLWEALPYALTETMACGCPVISTDCKYGPKEILGNNEYGILVPAMDGKLYHGNDPLTSEEVVLADAIIKLIESKDLRTNYSIKSLERAYEFESRKCIDEYEKYLCDSNCTS